MTGTTDLVNPATEQVLTTVPAATAEDADAAIARSAAALPAWRAVAPADRGRLLRRFAEVVDGHLEELARLEVANAGHTIGNARWEAGNVRDVLHYYAAAPERLIGRQIPVSGGIDVTFQEPLGVVGVIVPWNFPMPIAGWGFAPALAAGNTVVLKPAELTPLTAMRLGELALEAGIPADVFQVVARQGVRRGSALRRPPRRAQGRVHRVHRGGSRHHGRLRRAGEARDPRARRQEREHRLRRRRPRAGRGHRPLRRVRQRRPGLLRALADPGRAVRVRPVHGAARARRHGVSGSATPADEQTRDGSADLGRRTTEKVASFVPDGAPVAFRGSAPDGPVGGSRRPCWRRRRRATRPFAEEVFGPVVAVVPFDDEADAMRIANDTAYGLSGSIWTRDLGRALRTSRAPSRPGNLSVNSHSSVRYWTPFGGFKQSGIGRELGPDALDAFTEVKNVFIATEE